MIKIHYIYQFISRFNIALSSIGDFQIRKYHQYQQPPFILITLHIFSFTRANFTQFRRKLGKKSIILLLFSIFIDVRWGFKTLFALKFKEIPILERTKLIKLNYSAAKHQQLALEDIFSTLIMNENYQKGVLNCRTELEANFCIKFNLCFDVNLKMGSRACNLTQFRKILHPFQLLSSKSDASNNQLNIMTEKTHNKPKKYSQIKLEKRMKLVELVTEKGLFINRAAKRLNIKLSTAKLILRRYRTDGTFFLKKIKERPTKPTENSSQDQKFEIPESSQKNEQNIDEQKLELKKQEFCQPETSIYGFTMPTMTNFPSILIWNPYFCSFL